MKKLLITLFALLIGTAINASAIGSFGSFSSFLEKLRKETITQKIEWPERKIEETKKVWPIKLPEEIFKDPKTTKILEKIIPGIRETETTVVMTSVPDGGATLTFLGIALLGLVGAQRFIRRS